MSSRIEVTNLGRVVARSNLLPETAQFFSDYLKNNKDFLFSLLPEAVANGDFSEIKLSEASLDEFTFVVSHLCFSSPEYDDIHSPAQRYLPYQLQDERRNYPVLERVGHCLSVSPWDRNIQAVNAAKITQDYSNGTGWSHLEGQFEGLTAGVIANMIRDHSAHLSGLADILSVVTAGQSSAGGFVSFISTDFDVLRLRHLVSLIRGYIRRLAAGVPDDVVWLAGITDLDGRAYLNRPAIMRLRSEGFASIDQFLDGGRVGELHRVLSGFISSNDHRMSMLETVKKHREKRTQKISSRISRMLPGCDNLLGRYFTARNTEFEDAIEAGLGCADIPVLAKDDGAKPRYPDFVIEGIAGERLVIECKSKSGNGSVELAAATEIGGKATCYGLQGNHMVTICQPYVSSDVARKIQSAFMLSVVNAEDFALALAAFKGGHVTQEQFFNWLKTPGQIFADDLIH